MTTDRNYGAIRSADKLDILADRIIKAGKRFGFDIESGYKGEDRKGMALLTHHPDWILVGFSFTNDPNWARYVPIAHDSGDNIDDVVRAARALWRMLATGLGVAHNAKFELSGLSRWFMETLGDDPELGAEVTAARGYFPIRACTMLAAMVKGIHEYIGLKPLSVELFKHKMVEFKDLFPREESELGPATGKGKATFIRFNTRNVVPAVVNYACEDSAICLQIDDLYYEDVKDDFIFKIESALLPVLVDMEYEALYLNWAAIETALHETARFRDLMNEEIMADLSERLGEVININIGSWQQLAHILYERLGLPVKMRSKKTNAPSTSAKALKAIVTEDPTLRKILDYREVAKLYSSYLKRYLNEFHYDPNGRAYPNHKQEGAKTGRLAVDGASYQQWPKPYRYELSTGEKFYLNYRNFLIAPPGFRQIGFDFSQVELRIIASLSNEIAMLQAFRDNIDIHKATASKMYKVPLEEVTYELRGKGKTGNFAVVFQQGADALADALGCTKEEAQKILDDYFAGFPALRTWIDRQIASAREQGFVHTFFGRKCTIWEYKSKNNYIRSKGDRLAVNAPVQGSAADYMKIGMVRVAKAIRKAEADGVIPVDSVRLIMTIHDALEFYVRDDVETQTVIDIINPAVSFPVKGIPIEIRADWHEGYSWGAMVDIELDEKKKITGYSYEDEPEIYPDFPTALESRKTPIEKLANTEFDEFLTDDEEEDSPFGSDLIRVDEEPKPIKVAASAPPPPEGDDEPPWLHSPMYIADTREGVIDSYTIEALDMPTAEQWERFQTFMSARPGEASVTISFPEGNITLDTKHALVSGDQPMISMILGGADLREAGTVNFQKVSDGIL